MRLRKMLLPKVWRKQAESANQDGEDTYEIHQVPALSKTEREKHKQFFSQLDVLVGDDDETILTNTTSKTTDTREPDHRQRSGTESKQVASNKSLNTVLDDAGVESFSTFLGKIYCGCTSIGGDDLDSHDTKKEVRIDPVATVCSNRH